MFNNYVLVHGAWHSGNEMKAVAAELRSFGHTVYCPTLTGNREEDDRSTCGLPDAVDSLIKFIEVRQLQDVRLVGHSYGGMVISGAAERLLPRLARLVYVNAFVPMPGECMTDMVPPHFKILFDEIAGENNNALTLPFPIWRDVFINDADLALTESAYERLNPQPYRTFTDVTALSRPIAELPVGKSYVNCVLDVALPASQPWHPRLSERLGLYRYIESAGSHEAWFTEPAALAKAIERAGRD